MLLRGNVIGCSSVLAKRSVLLEFPMEKDECHEDYLDWLRILKKYGTACGVDEPLLKYRLSSTGKSGNKLHSAGMTYRVYRELGMGTFRSLYCFACYAVNGVRKYYGKGKKERKRLMNYKNREQYKHLMRVHGGRGDCASGMRCFFLCSGTDTMRATCGWSRSGIREIRLSS